MSSQVTQEVPKPRSPELRAHIATKAADGIRGAINPNQIGESIARLVVGVLEEVIQHEVAMAEDRHAEELGGAQDELRRAGVDWEELTDTVRRFHDEHHGPGFHLCAEPICQAAQGAAA